MFTSRARQLANARVLAIALIALPLALLAGSLVFDTDRLFDKITSDLALFDPDRVCFRALRSLGFLERILRRHGQFRCLRVWLPIEPIRPSFGSQRRLMYSWISAWSSVHPAGRHYRASDLSDLVWRKRS